MLSPMQETQHQKRAAVPLAPGLQPLAPGPVWLVRGASRQRRTLPRPVPGAGLQRHAPRRLALGAEFQPHGTGRPVQDSEFQPLGPERQRQERRCAM